MKKRLAALAHRRRALSETIEAQRMEVACITRQWQKPLVLVDAGLKVARFMHSHPGLVAGGVAVLLAWRRGDTVNMVQKWWRLLYLYPAALFLGVEYLFFGIRSPGTEEILARRPEERKTGDDL